MTDAEKSTRPSPARDATSWRHIESTSPTESCVRTVTAETRARRRCAATAVVSVTAHAVYPTAVCSAPPAPPAHSTPASAAGRSAPPSPSPPTAHSATVATPGSTCRGSADSAGRPADANPAAAWVRTSVESADSAFATEFTPKPGRRGSADCAGLPDCAGPAPAWDPTCVEFVDVAAAPAHRRIPGSLSARSATAPVQWAITGRRAVSASPARHGRSPIRRSVPPATTRRS